MQHGVTSAALLIVELYLSLPKCSIVFTDAAVAELETQWHTCQSPFRLISRSCSWQAFAF